MFYRRNIPIVTYNKLKTQGLMDDKSVDTSPLGRKLDLLLICNPIVLVSNMNLECLFSSSPYSQLVFDISVYIAYSKLLLFFIFQSLNFMSAAIFNFEVFWLQFPVPTRETFRMVNGGKIKL